MNLPAMQLVHAPEERAAALNVPAAHADTLDRVAAAVRAVAADAVDLAGDGARLELHAATIVVRRVLQAARARLLVGGAGLSDGRYCKPTATGRATRPFACQ